MYSDDDLLPLSALQHYLFCERQCALIHIERLWTENRFTAEGRVMHEHVHERQQQSRGKIRCESAVPLRSYRLGLVGVSDLVEFHKMGDGEKTVWQPLPVEYKRGKPKKGDWDKVQLCAQALCLEEMLAIDVPTGALYYGKTKRRLHVAFDEPLRTLTETTCQQLQTLIENGATPLPEHGPKCENCSLSVLCLPSAVARQESVMSYFVKALGPT